MRPMLQTAIRIFNMLKATREINYFQLRRSSNACAAC